MGRGSSHDSVVSPLGEAIHHTERHRMVDSTIPLEGGAVYRNRGKSGASEGQRITGNSRCFLWTASTATDSVPTTAQGSTMRNNSGLFVPSVIGATSQEPPNE
jgi:hypothetical protein